MKNAAPSRPATRTYKTRSIPRTPARQKLDRETAQKCPITKMVKQSRKFDHLRRILEGNSGLRRAQRANTPAKSALERRLPRRARANEKIVAVGFTQALSNTAARAQWPVQVEKPAPKRHDENLPHLWQRGAALRKPQRDAALHESAA